MSSLLAYGQGFLAEEIGSGAGLSEPWAQNFGWGVGEDSSVEQGPDGYRTPGSRGGLSQFYNLIQEAAPPEPEEKNSPKSLTRSSTKKDLHWDSPPQSPSTPFVHLPYAVLNIILTGTKADAVVVGVFQHGSECAFEVLLHSPRVLKMADDLVLRPDVLNGINGKVTFTEGLNIPNEFSTALGKRPQALVGHIFSMEKYKAIIFGLWVDSSSVPATAEGVFAEAAQSLPMLLSNRLNARTFEQLGRRFDAILKVMPDAVLFIDDESAQVVVNPAAASLLGLTSHGEVDPKMVSDAMRALTDRCKNRTVPQRWVKLLSLGEQLEIEEDWELKMPRRVLHVRSYPVISQAAHGRLWIYEDVTAERDAEEAIEAANRAKSQFLAMMSHELRTPMTGVLGMLDLLHLTDLEVEQQGLVQIMQESAEGLMDVINNILDFCKIEAGRLMLEEIDFSLGDILEQTESMLRGSILKKNLQMTISGDPSGRNVVRGDPVRLRQVLLNLISNAIKFTDHGRINVSWRFLDPQWVDTTVVATSQASYGKSKLINQIINASRGEKCTVEHSTTASGRSVIVVNCSSAGAAGPYLETSISAGVPPVPSVPLYLSVSHQDQHWPSSSVNNSANETSQGSGRTSFPVSYCNQNLKRPLSETFQSAETVYSFTERKSIAGKEPLKDSSLSGTVSQSSVTVHGDDPTKTFLQNANGRRPISESEGIGHRARKYQRLSLGRIDTSLHLDKNLGGSANDEALELNWSSKRRSALDANVVPSVSHSDDMTECRVARSSRLEKMAGKLASPLHPQSYNPVNDSVDKIIGVAPIDFKDTRSSDGVEYPQAHQNVRNGENREQSLQKELKPEDKVWFEVTISDTGVGIAKEQLDRLFVGSHAGSQRRNAAGTGLGLAICKGLLCLMNGKIQMDSKIGDGTTVILTVPLLPAEESVKALLESASSSKETSDQSGGQNSVSSTILLTPLTSQPPAASVVELPASKVENLHALSGLQPPTTAGPLCRQPTVAEYDPEARKVRVLVAEDNRVNQLLIRKMFKHFGHEVEVVGNGKLAVEAVQKRDFDLVLMDVQMPILDGLSATKAIRCLPPPVSQVPIYALSADNPGSGPLEETGLDGYLKKPIVWEMLSRKVAQILSSKR